MFFPFPSTSPHPLSFFLSLASLRHKEASAEDWVPPPTPPPPKKLWKCLAKKNHLLSVLVHQMSVKKKNENHMTHTRLNLYDNMTMSLLFSLSFLNCTNWLQISCAKISGPHTLGHFMSSRFLAIVKQWMAKWVILRVNSFHCYSGIQSNEQAVMHTVCAL